MNRLVGIIVMVLVLYGALLASSPAARSLGNHQNIGQRIGVEGVLALGMGLLIISGGIDLSVGSVVGLSGALFVVLMENDISPLPAACIVLAVSVLIGVIHGLLVTKLGLQPFLVTLCGLFVYRGLARCATWTPGTSSRSVGLSDIPDAMAPTVLAMRRWVNGTFFEVPQSLIILAACAGVLAVVLHQSVVGRYLYAIGANEQAARYAGIATDRYKILAYVLCSLLAGVVGLMSFLEVGALSPNSAGAWYELYAITAAVLGGCSLRGGEGSVPGLVLGAMMLPLLRTFCLMVDIPDDLQPAVVGLTLLNGTIVDEVLKRRAARRF